MDRAGWGKAGNIRNPARAHSQTDRSLFTQTSTGASYSAPFQEKFPNAFFVELSV